MRKARPLIDADKVHAFLTGMFEQDLHARRVLSLANATTGVIHAASLSVHAIGLGLAWAEGLESKHAIKQVDRLLSNTGIDVWELFEQWVPFLLAGRTEAVVALDWTEFDADNQSTIAIHLVTSHGRATPLVWKTVVKSELKGWRNDHEDAVIARLLEVVPKDLKVTLLADRGFGDQKLFALLKRWSCDYVIRFRGGIAATDEAGETRKAKDWVPANGRPVLLRNASITRDQTPLPAVICVKAEGMKEAWCLATSLSDQTAAEVVKLYSRRFTIEENFRDSKNARYGFGLSQSRVSVPARRDRLFLISALAIALLTLLTLLGAAGESLGFERLMKANTVKRRSYSLLRQGCHYYECIPAMKPEKLKLLLAKFADLVTAQSLFRDVFGLL